MDTNIITALYDADGIRRNANLAFSKPADAPASGFYSKWDPSSLVPNSATWADQVSYYIYTDYIFENLFDNASSMMNCSQSFNSGVKPRLVMRLADDCPEIVSVDIAQYNGLQTPSAFELEGSLDGQTWTALVSTNALVQKSNKWYFSTNLDTVGDTEPRKLSEGEGLGFAVRAAVVSDCSVLENVNAYSVAPGATLTTEGSVQPIISKLSVDGRLGAGTISGNFKFAKNVTLDIIGAAKGAASLPHGFAGVAGFEDVNWTVTFDGESSKYSAKVTESGIDIIPPGLMIIFR